MGKLRPCFEVMVDYMERHGDLCKPPPDPQGRKENLRKWEELVEHLNSQLEKEDTKSVSKWRKNWSDFKTVTKRKVEKIRSGKECSELSDLEKRVLRLIGYQGVKKLSCLKDSAICKSGNFISMGNKVKREISTSSPPRFFGEVTPTSRRRQSSSSSSESSTSSSQPLKKKRRSSDTKSNDNNSMTELAEKFLQFERERDKMSHEREMARIKQNEQLITLFGRIANVLETIAPSIQRYLDRDGNDESV